MQQTTAPLRGSWVVPPACPILELESLTSRGPDICTKGKLEGYDLDILGVNHGRVHRDFDTFEIGDACLD